MEINIIISNKKLGNINISKKVTYVNTLCTNLKNEYPDDIISVDLSYITNNNICYISQKSSFDLRKNIDKISIKTWEDIFK